MTNVAVKLFATLRRHYPELEIGEAMPVTLPERTTVAQLVERLELPKEQVKLVFVNGRVQKGAYVLCDGDEVGMFPPVGGG
jgi:sulfur-carrier protein